ncbi:unnamed protein product [Periconia digitata]|uniref:Uncharacterized protein n=1 Tax=Periconia digitata TaxID=1303443 RepID=A0A9W4UUM2_9PLEO|nr:unnamed protein product [Periconia digitata]
MSPKPTNLPHNFLKQQHTDPQHTTREEKRMRLRIEGCAGERHAAPKYTNVPASRKYGHQPPSNITLTTPTSLNGHSKTTVNKSESTT